MIYQRDRIIDSESETMYRRINDPVELLLEYRLITLDALKAGAEASGAGAFGAGAFGAGAFGAGASGAGASEFYCGEPEAECGTRYCILIIASDRFGGTEIKFLYDVTRDRSVAVTLLKTLYDGAVTPCTAKYIVEDIL